ncbi:hypothetical protein HPB48_013275 [Haemaphysalis longicornis]|uniref:Ionotropic receptor n=1 Tax=Haemaphysalis longicornis TaxID=44386 RepID=A0A9J6FS27_HAELO|nr:hypothetical protein HPB48_013275 [Haemaphysalis longicornis]
MDFLASITSTGALTHLVLLLNKKEFRSQASSLKKSATRVDISAVQLDEMDCRAPSTYRKELMQKRRSQNTRFLSTHYKRSNSNPETFSGETVRLGCVVLGKYDTCKYQYNVKFMSILSHKNVSLKLTTYGSFHGLHYDIYANKIDLGFVRTVLRQDSLASLSFGEVTFVYGSFYALNNKTRVVSLLDALGSSNCSLFAFLSLAFCAIAAAASRRNRRFIEYVHDTFNELFFLLAPLFGTSSELPLFQRAPNSRTVVYVVWILAVLPFSVYFRSELTSLVTVHRPADVLDTLGELENALNDERLLPCVTEGTGAHADLEGTSNRGGVLIRKLGAAYRRHKIEGLLKTSIHDCFHCAARENHVCFNTQYPVCWVKAVSPDVAEFKENFMADFWVFPMPKDSRLTRPFKRFMDSIRENLLLSYMVDNCDMSTPTHRTTTDLLPFLANWFVLLCLSGVVLIGEVFAARFCSRT